MLNLWRPGDQGRLRRRRAASLREFQRGSAHTLNAAVSARKLSARMCAPPMTGAGGTRPTPAPTSSARAALAELNATIYVLRALAYIGEDSADRARAAAARHLPSAGITVELLLSGALERSSPAELAEVISWFTFDGDKLRNCRSSFVSARSPIRQAGAASAALRRVVREFE